MPSSEDEQEKQFRLLKAYFAEDDEEHLMEKFNQE
jgi:hypothetical protein